MSRNKIVAGNWKMNTLLEEARQLVEDIKVSRQQESNVTVLVFPPFPFLKQVSDLLQNENLFYCGAQNCSRSDKGAYTGEVSAGMIASAGGRYVIIGHSERRMYFGETSAELREKIEQALKNNLGIVYCFGEHLQERKAGQHFSTVKNQLEEVLQHFPSNQTDQLILAYEPVWAIGTGETASPDEAQEMHAFVRKTIAGIFSGTAAAQMSILYGGSCNAQNAAELFACPDVDGGLIGGASLKAADFCKIIASF